MKTKLVSTLIGMTVVFSCSVAMADVTLGSEPDKNLIGFTQCSDISLDNIMTGKLGDYTFQKGFSTEERSGFINRQKHELKHNCILPSLQPYQIVYMEVDTEQYKAAGSSNDWEMQCVKSDNPGEGVVSAKESRSESPYTVDYLAGKDLMLHCGHSENLAEDCAEGSNSSRSGKWKKKLKGSGKTMLSVLANKSSLAPAGGEKLYCQYFNKVSGKSLFAFEFLRSN